MFKETNLEKVKETAKLFLHLPIKQTEIPFLGLHPFFTTTATMLISENRMVDLNNEEDLEKVLKELSNLIEKAKDAAHVYFMIRDSYRLTFFKYINDYLSIEDFSTLLANAWVMSENPNQDTNVSTYQASRYFKKADKKILMSEEEYKIYTELPEEFEIYRGVAIGRNPKGMSWTRELSTAEWFANRFNTKNEVGYVQAARVKKKNVLAYFSRENEIVVYSRDLMDLHVI